MQGDAIDLVARLVIARAPGVRGREERRKKGSKLHDAKSEEAVESALHWLARFQDSKANGLKDADGRWDARGFAKHAPASGLNGAGMEHYDVGVSAIAVLAFLGAGYSGGEGQPFRDTVREGLGYLLRSQDKRGLFGPIAIARRNTQHAAATVALCEAWILTNDLKYREPAQRAVDFLAANRGPKDAWGYPADSIEPDSYTTSWVLAAFATARMGGLRVEPNAVWDGLRWFLQTRGAFNIDYDTRGGASAHYAGTAAYAWEHDEIRMPDGSPGFKFLAPADGTRGDLFLKGGAANRGGPTEFALWCELAFMPGSRGTSKEMMRTSGVPTWGGKDGKVDFCAWAYKAPCYAQAHGAENPRSETVAWFKGLRTTLLAHQSKEGSAAGSWDPEGVWMDAGGRVCATAMAARALEAPYLYGLFARDTRALSKPGFAALGALRRLTREGPQPIRKRAEQAVGWIGD